MEEMRQLSLHVLAICGAICGGCPPTLDRPPPTDAAPSVDRPGPWVDRGAPGPDSAPADLPGPDHKTCSADAECDDGIACTTDTCQGGVCQNPLQTGYCLIGGTCFPAGPDPADACRTCDPAKDSAAWTTVTCVSTLAGSGSHGHVDGAAASAEFRDPSDVAVDSKGQVYVADRHNHRIRLVAAGQVSTFAGTGSIGSANGPAASATFFEPTGVWLDSGGQLFVADRANNHVRLIAGGQVSTLSSANELLLPSGGAAASSGEIYVADTFHHRIVKIPAAGGAAVVVAGTGVAGHADGAAASARFFYPTALALDSKGTVYVADTLNHRVRSIAAGQVATLAGSGTPGYTDGAAASARFNNPRGIDVDAQGDVYVSDTNNHCVRLVSAGQVSTLAGRCTHSGHDDGLADQAEFNDPWGLAVDSQGNVYVADTDNDRIRLITR